MNEDTKNDIKNLTQQVKKSRSSKFINLRQAPTIPLSSMSHGQHLRFLQVNALYSINVRNKINNFL